MSLPTAQLEQLLSNAKRIKSPEFADVINEHKDLFERYRFRLRPSVGSISLISCSYWTPQLGFSNMTSGSILRKKLEALRQREIKLQPPDRPTPEKAVQSWLISQAMQNDGRIDSIGNVLADGHSYWFVADEIALNASSASDPDDNPEKIVADLLLVRVNGQGESEIVNVELKSQRSAETHGQILKFWKFMEPNQLELWQALADIVLGGDKPRWKERGENRGIVIWPGMKKETKPVERTMRLMAEYRSKGIDTICYSGPEYSFQPEPSLA